MPVVAIIGGTGRLGSALARRWVEAGYRVVIGSRTPARAREAARALGAAGGSIAEAVLASEVVMLAVPYACHDALLAEIDDTLNGRILLEPVVPVDPADPTRALAVPGGSVAAAAQARLGRGVRVVAAFQTVAAKHLRSDAARLDMDVLVCGNDRSACRLVLHLVEAAGLRGWLAGPIANAAASEALAPVLRHLNREYRLGGAGLRVVAPGRS